jgi:hypothetical protein
VPGAAQPKPNVRKTLDATVHSPLNLAAARLRHIAGAAWSTKCYLNIELLKDQQMCHHRLSECRAPLSQNHMCEKLWTLPIQFCGLRASPV